jgi:hypothetical protein
MAISRPKGFHIAIEHTLLSGSTSKTEKKYHGIAWRFGGFGNFRHGISPGGG